MTSDEAAAALKVSRSWIFILQHVLGGRMVLKPGTRRALVFDPIAIAVYAMLRAARAALGTNTTIIEPTPPAANHVWRPKHVTRGRLPRRSRRSLEACATVPEVCRHTIKLAAGGVPIDPSSCSLCRGVTPSVVTRTPILAVEDRESFAWTARPRTPNGGRIGSRG